MKFLKYSLISMLFFVSCKNCKDPDAFSSPKANEIVKINTDTLAKPDIIVKRDTINKVKSLAGLPDTLFVNLKLYSDDFTYDMRYATTNNFLKTKVYDCAECYTLVKTAKALIAANKEFMSKGYHIKFFDCYRPHDVQKQMWKIVPNPQYVANPAKGSVHNRGGAVDITLVDSLDNELNMGTDFDYFGKLAHHDNQEVSQEILANRTLLKTTMEKHGFWSIRTEWWHYNLNGTSGNKVANFKWDCDGKN